MMNAMKRIIVLVLCTILVFVNPMNVSAADIKESTMEIHLTDNQTGKTYEIPVSEEKSVTKQNGNTYIVTKVAEFQLPISNSTISPCTEVEDAGKTVRIKFNVKYTNSGNRYQLNGVTGWYKILDPAFSISNRLVMYTNQYNFSQGHVWEKHPSSNSFSYSATNDWIDTTEHIEYWIGGYAQCTISRGGYSWDLRATEDIIKNVK